MLDLGSKLPDWFLLYCFLNPPLFRQVNDGKSWAVMVKCRLTLSSEYPQESCMKTRPWWRCWGWYSRACTPTRTAREHDLGNSCAKWELRHSIRVTLSHRCYWHFLHRYPIYPSILWWYYLLLYRWTHCIIEKSFYVENTCYINRSSSPCLYYHYHHCTHWNTTSKFMVSRCTHHISITHLHVLCENTPHKFQLYI